LNKDSKIWDSQASDSLKLADYQSFLDFGQKLVKWAQMSYSMPLPDLLSHIIAESGLLDYLKSLPNYVTLLTHFYTFHQVVSAWQRQNPSFQLEDLFVTLEAMTEHGRKLSTPSLDPTANALCLTTVHKAKGREWRHVFIYGLNDGVWSNQRARTRIPLPDGIVHQDPPTNDIAEQVRLLYVALTRAKERNFISWHLHTSDGLTNTPKVAASMVSPLQSAPTLAQTCQPPAAAATTAAHLVTLLTPPAPIDFSVSTKDFFTQRVRNLTLSASMLNTYLIDVNAFIERYLLQAPPPPITPAAALGNSLHYVLQQAVQSQLTTQMISPLASLLEAFDQDFARRRVSEPDFSAYRRLGQDSLAAYYPQLDNIRPIAVERNFGCQPRLVCGQVPITGKIDRIDLVDLDSDLVRVIDYKSGTPMTINQILGQTASIKLSPRERSLPPPLQTAQLRQLLFYKLLVQLEPRFPYRADVGVLEFIKTTPDRKPVSRQIDLPDEHVALLQDLIQEVWQEIQSLAFLPSASPNSFNPSSTLTT
jgi:ATP-dependent exoDNAse (exonuclease V) beta subunit